MSVIETDESGGVLTVTLADEENRNALSAHLVAELSDVLDEADAGAGVLVLVDLWGASPCSCARAQAGVHRLVTLAGLNLAMLLKVAGARRPGVSAEELAQACADSGRRAVQVKPEPEHDQTHDHAVGEERQ